LAALLAQAVALHPAGFALLDPVVIAVAGEAGERALDRVVAVIGGAAYPARRDRLARLRQALAVPAMRPRTLGGCRFVGWRGRVLVLREAARAAAPLVLEPGMQGVWDGRFFARVPATAAGPVTIAALGATGVAALGRGSLVDDNPLPRLVYPVLPAIWDERGPVAVPHLAWHRNRGGCAPLLSFRPVVALFSAGFTVV